MAPAISPDLQQNIVTTIYLLFSHNYIAFAYLCGLLLSVALSLLRPSRFATLCFLGFAVLLFSFEYDKHLISALREQTIKSFITEKPHYRLSRIIDVAVSEILPIVFYVAGWVFLFVAIVYEGLKGRKKNPSIRDKTRAGK